ncbi:MAG: helix-turn-helix domain-containing protein [Candidatus Dormibacteraeota bacterium]|uniref:Helix-turn-helix domain-containing protein n=1 Tax=Candidatus Amunia macphersoniae TaxID=3127014 RepID=A0A934KFQ5_9BACT|nr:helix-turn-helix domain-containing protein [Candidatus Dormibacteraeota bacterium]
MTVERDLELLDVRQVATRVGRSAETIRRWIWSGRLAAQKQGNRLLIQRADADRVIAGRPQLSLAEWVAEREEQQQGTPRRQRSAADLIMDDRRRRSSAEPLRARR